MPLNIPCRDRIYEMLEARRPRTAELTIFSFPLGWLTFIGIRLLVKLESPEKKGGREKEMPVEERGRERKAREGNSNEGGPKAVSVKYKTSSGKSRMTFSETPTPSP